MNEENCVNNKILKNALMFEKLSKLSKDERQLIIKKLLVNKSERELEKELGMPHSTIHDWATGRQDNVGVGIHISLCMIIRKLKDYKIKDKIERLQLLEIKNIIEDKLGDN